MQRNLLAGVEIDGEMTYKGSEAHKAAVPVILLVIHSRTLQAFNEHFNQTYLFSGLVIAPILGDGHGESKKSFLQ